MSIKLEKERKFLIKVPSSWDDISNIFDNLIDIKRIKQTYLKPENDEQAARVRETVEGLGDVKTVYHFNQKNPVETGVHKEKEFEITKSQYEKYLKNHFPGKYEVAKTRFVFDFDNQEFELDIFKKQLKGLAILEVELKNIDDKINIPDYLKVIKEVTKEEKFNNFNLASIKKNNEI